MRIPYSANVNRLVNTPGGHEFHEMSTQSYQPTGSYPRGHEFMNFMKFMKSVPDRTNPLVHTPSGHEFRNFMKFIKSVSMPEAHK